MESGPVVWGTLTHKIALKWVITSAMRKVGRMICSVVIGDRNVQCGSRKSFHLGFFFGTAGFSLEERNNFYKFCHIRFKPMVMVTIPWEILNDTSYE